MMRSVQTALLVAAALPAPNVLAAYLSAPAPAPRINSCGVKGYTTNTDAYFYDDSGKYSGHDKCNAQCQADSNCQSYGYDAKKLCMLYNVVVYGNFEDDSDSPYIFYNRGCITPSSSTSLSMTVKPTTTQVTTTSSTKVTTSSTTKATTLSTKATTPSTTKAVTSLSTKVSTLTVTTTSSKPSTTTTKSTFSSSTGITIPSGCPIPTSYTVTSFRWVNTTHNLDCAKGPDIGDGTGCLSPTGNWCDPNLELNCTHCGIPLCMTGLPEQAVGYGPPDDLEFTFSDGTSCRQYNAGEVRRYEDGEGRVNCGGLWDFLNFWGSSNDASSVGTAQVNSNPTQCSDGDSIFGTYFGTFQLNCLHDAQRNATCTTPRAFTLPLTGFTKTKSNK